MKNYLNPSYAHEWIARWFKNTGLINFLILINLKIYYYYCKSLLYACMQHNFFFLNLFLAQSSMPIFMSPNNHVLKHSCLLCLLLHPLLAMNKISFKVGSKIHKTVAYKYKKKHQIKWVFIMYSPSILLLSMRLVIRKDS